MNVLVLADAGGAELVTGFAFGLFAGLTAWLWWPLLVLALLVEGIFATRQTVKEHFGSAFFLVLLAAVTLHLFGAVDMIGLVRHHWLDVAMWLGGIFGFGLVIYTPVRGYIAARRSRDALREKLVQAKARWMDEQRHRGGRGNLFDEDAAEQLWQDEVKAKKWAEIKSVDNDKERIFFWVFFWPLDLAWHLVFQWFDRLEDLFRLVWRAIRHTAQRVKDSAVRGAEDGV
ncbi:MAG: hypothetical protein KDD64_09510 [Bdellovibrionales bacterium]|nr:hypothetical protein [Bdellovibrionales bacterium]